MPKLTQADLAPLNQTFDERTPQELLRWAKQVFGDRLAALSAMQMAGSVVCHMMSQLQLNSPVLFVDTGVNFAETLETRDRIAADYGLNVITLQPDLTMTEQTEKYGVLYLTVEGQQQCCDMRKTAPLLKARGQFDGLIGSLRRAEGGKRDRCPILSVDPPMNCVRINPLANFDNEQMQAYIAEHNVIVNPLHYQGFATISCNRCTTPVLPNEPKRAGRWRHLGPWSVYCGINPTDVDGGTGPSVELSQDLIDRIFGRVTDFAI
ncbi:phosphoadenylyl-sulfate reductase [bacterium]|nr:phosphoadenylyl-sulfate reductase [bacterium]